MDSPGDHDEDWIKIQRLSLKNKNQELTIHTLEQDVAYLKEKIEAQELMLTCAFLHIKELERKLTQLPEGE